MSYAHLTPAGSGALPVLSLRVELVLRGLWRGEVELDTGAAAAPAPGSLCSLTIGSRTLVGTVERSAAFGGRARLALVAGKGRMGFSLRARAYRDALTRTVLRDIVRDAGETIDETTATTLPASVLGYWTRAAASAATCLSTACEAAGFGWRFTDAGAIRIAVEAWPAASEVDVLVEGERGADPSITIAPLHPTLSPGTTWRGRRIESVVYTLGEEEQTLAAELVFERSIRTLFERAARAVLRELRYTLRWPARVAGQDAEGRLELVPDDAEAPGSPPVPVLLGLPGARVELPIGARCGLVFEGGDQRRPRASGFEQGTPAKVIRLDASELIELAGETSEAKSVHREGDRGEVAAFSAPVGPLIVSSGAGDHVWQILGVCNGIPVVFSVVPVVGDGGRLVSVAGPGSSIVKAGG